MRLNLSAPGSPKRSWVGPFRVSRLVAGLLTLTTLTAINSAQGQKPLANIASVDRTLGTAAPASQALQEGRVAAATALLRAILSANPANAGAHQLLCRVFYAQNEVDEAIQECELAVSLPATSSAEESKNQLWLGRAYGMKARHAGPLAGFGFARKVQSSFARAVQLDPSNVAAVNDLGEYDVNAPFIVGGGTDKAQALAQQITPSYPGAAHLLLARIAEADKDLPKAEAELKKEIAVERSPEAWINLGYFYESHDRADDALAAVKSGLAIDRKHGPVLVDAASILTAAHRAPDLAERCLRDYLASRAKSDAAPAFKVHLQLSKLLAARGDDAGASREVAAAAALAPSFARTTQQVHGL